MMKPGRWYRSVIAVLVGLGIVIATVPALARGQISSWRLGAHPDSVTRLVMDVSESMTFSVATQSNPDRVVVTISGADWSAPRGGRPYGLVRGVDYTENGGTGQILVDLKGPGTVRSAYMMSPREGLGWRFVLDIQSSPAPSPVRSATVQPTQPKPSTEAKPTKLDTAKPTKLDTAKPTKSDAANSFSRGSTNAVWDANAPQDGSGQTGKSRSIVVYSPSVTPPAANVVPASPSGADSSAVSEGASSLATPVPTASPGPAPLGESAPVKASATVLSAPIPPPLERPGSEAVPAVQQATAHPATPGPAPAPEPKRRAVDDKPVIVIDPGHGGQDPGAIGVSGIYEKNLTLAMARELRDSLMKTGRFKVYLTRDRDVFIRLRDRIAISRQYNADLFISLHADAVANPAIRGLSVYTLSQNASDTESQALADKENKADLIAGVDLSHETADVTNILIDLAQRETMNRSAGFASNVVDEVGREISLLSNTHRFAGFAVLKAPDVPAVLVEMGYLSNESEEHSLRQPAYRAKLAKAMSRAIERFFLQGQKARRP